MNVDDLVAGPELDALVAVKIFGRRGGVYSQAPHEQPTAMYFIEGSDGAMARVPAYSTDIAAAWEVVEKCLEDYSIRKRGAIVSLTEKYPAHWEVLETDGEGSYQVVADAETAPLAICRAALKAVRA